MENQLETVQMAAAKRVLGCSSTTSNTVLRAELGMYPLNNQRREKVDRAIESKEDAKKRLPAIADRAVWEKVTKGRAGVRWDSVVEKVWKDIRGNQEEILQLSIDKFEGYETEVKEKRNKGKASAKKQGERGGTLIEIYGGLREETGMKTYLHGPMDYAKTLKLRFRVGNSDLPERRNRYTTS